MSSSHPTSSARAVEAARAPCTPTAMGAKSSTAPCHQS